MSPEDKALVTHMIRLCDMYERGYAPGQCAEWINVMRKAATRLEALSAPASVPDAVREAVTRCVELAIIRHGVDEAHLEGTLDDADAILAALATIPAARPLTASESQCEEPDDEKP